MKAKRKAELIRIELTDVEASLLSGLIDDFGLMLDEPHPDDPVLQRLFPDGYPDDEQASAEYRGLVEADLRAERSGRLQLCRAELPEGGGRFALDAEATDRWLRVLNDLRLALGTRLGVSETVQLDDSEPVVSIYHWLSSVQEMLVSHVLK